MITNDRNVLVIILDINSRGLKKVKASIQNITKLYSNIIVKVYFKKDDIPIDLIETIPSVMSSSREIYRRSISRLTKVIIVHDKACIPCVLEKISTIKPVKNAIVKAQLILIVIGRRIIKYMNTIGIAILNKHILLNIIT